MEYCNGMMYAVKNGDTLYSISMKYNIPLAILLRANPYVDVYNLQVGETICLPMKTEQNCGEQGNERCTWEGGEAPVASSNELQETAENGNMGEESRMVQENMEREQPLNRGEIRERDNMQWERYVTQPGDTLDIVLGGSGGMQDDDWEDILEDFVEKNGVNQIYLLPGIVYYRRK